MNQSPHDVLVVKDTQGLRVPLVIDSPHSGIIYPPDFRFICDKKTLEKTEDRFVDVLFDRAPHYGAALLLARITRNYVDLNRACDDVDAALVDGGWPYGYAPTQRFLAGHGLFRHSCRGQNLYAGKIPTHDLQRRVAQYYWPYHDKLYALLHERAAAFGSVWHINAHSMPAQHHGAQPDFIVGDRDGASADPSYSAIMINALRAMGYRVAHNHFYKGAEIITRYGHPHHRWHAVQLEISRALYMDEDTLVPHAGFAILQANLEKLLQTLTAWVLAQCGDVRAAAE